MLEVVTEQSDGTHYVISPDYTGPDRRKVDLYVDTEQPNGIYGAIEIPSAPQPRIPIQRNGRSQSFSAIKNLPHMPLDVSGDTATDIFHIMYRAGAEFIDTINQAPTVEPDSLHERRTTIDVGQIALESLEGSGMFPGSWRPSSVHEYSSRDPYQLLNPEKTQAMTQLIQTVMDLASVLKTTKDPVLTYIDNMRARNGKRGTVLTQALQMVDEGIGDWIQHLPDAELLRPVAHPWSETETITTEDGLTFQGKGMTRAQQVLMGGSDDGRAVREREAWERWVLGDIKDTLMPQIERDGSLVITSLGTGTGEPIVDTGVGLIDELYAGDDIKTIVNGFDLNPRSLAVARYIASQKRAAQEGVLDFRGIRTNILSEEGIRQCIGGTAAHIYEAIGFSEYVPSENATSPEEIMQRKTMERLGSLSAEAFIGTIYEHMPEGSVLLTGNMRDDSRQGSFVVQGLGWQGIIQRSTREYLGILENAGVPGKAVRLYVPNPASSAAVYNLVAITKL